jgi:16S rRNA (cytosine967-C5)-methyltransferase
MRHPQILLIMKNAYNLRSIAAQTINQVLDHGQSLSAILPEYSKRITEKDSTLLQEICFGVMRTLPQLEWCIQQLMAKPLTGKQRVLHYLIMVGLYQLISTRIPAHAALAETVEGATALKKPQLKGLINGVLRQFQRQQDELLLRSQNNDCRYLHPSWLLKRIQHAYPDHWEQTIAANNQKPPMWLRVNAQHHTREQYQELLQQVQIEAIAHPEYRDALRLITPCPVNMLPGFSQGWVSIQDASAQGCVSLLDPKDGESILDLCCAPGGKTTHILELAPKAQVLGVDVEPQRLKRVHENLQRLGLQAEIKQGDGCTPELWANGRQFDRILLDAPCSATGVIRRHPDIKWLRRNSDINELVNLQKQIINAIWPYLKPGGVMVYATCSILPEENSEQIKTFLASHHDASIINNHQEGIVGQQHLPNADSGDGFYYAKLIKNSEQS